MLLVQLPVAAHEVALDDDQVSVELPPLAILVGLAFRVTVGRCATVTVADAVPVPPVPVQEIVYVVVAPIPFRDCAPLLAVLLLQPPVAAQALALVEFHVSVELPPEAMVGGVAAKVTTGRGTTVIVVLPLAVPPLPVHVSV